MSRWFSIVSVVPVALALVACVDDPETALGTATQLSCPKWGCGENSPLMGPYEEHEYDASGAQVNSEGSRVVALVQGGQAYEPRIVGGSQLIGVQPDGSVISGAGLTNAYFLISTPTGPYKIIIKKVTPRASSQVRFWIGPQTQIETYELMYLFAGRGPATHPEPLCHNPPERDAGEGSPTRMWNAPLEAILYSGDRYDADEHTVTASSYPASGPWFNIACAGSALAKLHLTRHTTAGSLSTHPSTAAQRQAMLRMYVSDLCGTGASFTEQGTPLHWTNSKGWSQLTGMEFAPEALWNENGALCLDTHRRGTQYMADIVAECPMLDLNPCPPTPPGGALPLGAYLRSAVPFDPNLP